MSKLKWSDAFTNDSPPKAKRRRVEPLQNYSQEKWDEMRPLIEELYKKHELKKVIRILRDEGFVTSERRLITRLHAWGNSKYIGLSKEQWRYIEHKAVARTLLNPEAKISCRYKDTKKQIPSAKIQRNLDRRMAKKHFSEVLSMNGTVSSHGISVFTSETKGFRLRGLSFKFDDEALNRSTLTVTNLDDVPENEETGPSQDSWAELGFKIPHSSSKEREDPDYNRFKDSLRRLSNTLIADLRAKYPHDKFDLVPFALDADNFQIMCADCPDFYWPLRNPTRDQLYSWQELKDIAAQLQEFEKEHILRLQHRRRVQGRLLAEVPVLTEIPRCQHVEPSFDSSSLEYICWDTGGCQWASGDRSVPHLSHEPFVWSTINNGVDHWQSDSLNSYNATGEKEALPDRRYIKNQSENDSDDEDHSESDSDDENQSESDSDEEDQSKPETAAMIPEDLLENLETWLSSVERTCPEEVAVMASRIEDSK